MRTTINDGDLLLVDVSPAAVNIVEGNFMYSRSATRRM